MPEYDNTDNVAEHPWLDAEDWEVSLQPYADHPDLAVMLAIHFTILKSHIADEPLKLKEATNELDQAIEVLFMHTELRDTCYVLFRRMAEGRLSTEEEKFLKLLGYQRR